jgi:hypothetical protein
MRAQRVVAGPLAVVEQAVDVAAQAVAVREDPVPEDLEPEALQSLQFPVVGRPVRRLSLRLPWLKAVNRVRAPRVVVEAAVAEVVVAVKAPVVVAVAAVLLPAERVAVALPFQAWRSSTCCSQLVWI